MKTLETPLSVIIMGPMTIFLSADPKKEYREEGWQIPHFGGKSLGPLSLFEYEEEFTGLDRLLVKYARNEFQNTLFRMIDERHLKDSQVYRLADVDRRYFSKIRNGLIPKKNTVIALALAMRLSMEETEELLYSAGYVLTDFRHTDIVIRYCIRRRIYRLDDVNELLENYGLAKLR